MEISELKNWFTSMIKPEGLENKPSNEPAKMEGLLTRRDYFGVAFGALSIVAILFFLTGVIGLLKDAFADPEGLINTIGFLCILIGVGAYFYALKFKPNSRYWGEIGTFSLVIFFTYGFLSIGTTMEWWEEIKTGIFILLFLYIPVLYLRKNLLGGLVFAILLMGYAGGGPFVSSLGPILRLVGGREILGIISGEFTSFWFWFFFITFIPYFTLSFKENFRPGVESIILGYSFSSLLLFGTASALGSHQMFGTLLAASLLYLIGKIVYKHNYILFKPFQLVSVFVFISASAAMLYKGSMMGLYGQSGYLSFVNSILKEWTAYIALLVVAVASFMVFMIWKSEYVDNDRKANVIPVVLPFYFLLMAPFVNWGLEDVVVILNRIVIMVMAFLVVHYSLKDNKWYNLLWAPALAIAAFLALGSEASTNAKYMSGLMLVCAGALGGFVFKFLPKVGESMAPGEDDGDSNEAPTPSPTPSPAPEAKVETPKTEEPKVETTEKPEETSNDAPSEEEKSE